MPNKSYQFGLYGFQLSSDLLSLQPDSPVREIIIDQYNPAPDAGNKTEGAYLLQHGDYNYLFYSIGQCCASPADGADAVYRVEVCRGPAGSVTGPYVDRNGIDCLTGGYRREGTVVLFSSGEWRFSSPTQSQPPFSLSFSVPCKFYRCTYRGARSLAHAKHAGR